MNLYIMNMICCYLKFNEYELVDILIVVYLYIIVCFCIYL